MANLQHTLERLREDHGRIREAAALACRMAEEVKRCPVEAAQSRVRQVERCARTLGEELVRHGQWEGEVLFPLLSDLYPMESNPDLPTSLWMLEKEHQTAAQCYRAYLHDMQSYFELRDEQLLRLGMTELAHACRLIRGHLDSETELLVPLCESRVDM
ncbi:hemerythrin domain-containing protein [Paenibacillus methanolicus]|uniref:Hemerythrin HHE cation binding domain-containing protein n=1 Tax=Paenibacillus methanolicus TaxID=582686 RepID=A0A5S5BX65_9BACL|nr:hemerythrin domain-containing protein [Paenibacillus methanolicus]TYP71765.1 hemerythrin HHE cation binding domain-containing protein [Paenibacillus methanolicus]